MQGQMMSMPLLTSSLLVHAERHHGDQEIVSRRVEGDLHRMTYRDLGTRSRQLARALERLGVQASQRVATLAWNGHRHMELYYAVSGMGSVLHTINPRLHADQVVYIADHAEDQVLFFDLTFLPLVEAVASRLATVRAFVALTDRAHLPDSTIPGLLCYEDLLAAERDDYTWPKLDEEEAATLCTPPGPPATPRACFTATGPRCCTPSARPFPTP